MVGCPAASVAWYTGDEASRIWDSSLKLIKRAPPSLRGRVRYYSQGYQGRSQLF